MAATTLHVGTGVDTRDFAAFAKALRVSAPDIWVDLRAGLRVAGQAVAARARRNAAAIPGKNRTDRIEQSIKVRVSGTGTVSVIAGGLRAPEAGPLENKGRLGEFRHPVFGNRQLWVKQLAHPFLTPAVKDGMPEASQAAVDALDRAVTRAATLFLED